MVKLCEPPSKAGKLGSWHQVHAIGADAGSYDEFSCHRHLGGPFDVSHLLVSCAGFLGGFHGLRLVTEDVVYIWNYRSSVSRQAQAGGKRSLKIVLFFFEADCLCARIWILLEMHCKR